MRAFRVGEAFDGSTFLGPTTVLVDGESIVGVERGHPDLPDGVEVATYDGTLLPGLFDCHVHLVSTSDVGSLEAAGSASDEVRDARSRPRWSRRRPAESPRSRTSATGLPDPRARAEPGLPRVLAAGPPLTIPDGHCHYLGGAASGRRGRTPGGREHVERGVDVIKVMASGGMVTPGTNVYAPQFSGAELAACVSAGHAAGLRVLAHAHALSGVQHAVSAGVDGIEHFTCLTEAGVVTPAELLVDVVSAGITVDLTLGIDPSQSPPLDKMPPGIRACWSGSGWTWRRSGRPGSARRGSCVSTASTWSPAPTRARLRPSDMAPRGGRCWSWWRPATRPRTHLPPRRPTPPTSSAWER